MKTVCQILEINWDESLSKLGSHWWPNRGLGPMPPTDPVIYRLYEVCAYALCVGDDLMSFTERSRLWTCYQGERLQSRMMTRPDIELMKAVIHEKVLKSRNSNGSFLFR